MELSFVKLSPTQNVTVLVETPVARSAQSRVAARLLDWDSVGGEQVGYIEPPTRSGARLALRMMGGEFCGNATMSLGAYLAWKEGLPEGETASWLFEVSGCDENVPCRIRREGDRWRGEVRMPLPTALETVRLTLSGRALEVPLVRMPGICHLLLPPDADEAALRECLPCWHASVGGDALGAILWDEAASAIDPLVYVPSTHTLVREHGCGSGTAAVGCWMAARQKTRFRQAIRQPGGEITVDAQWESALAALTSVTIAGAITLTAAGTAFLPD